MAEFDKVGALVGESGGSLAVCGPVDSESDGGGPTIAAFHIPE